MTSAEVKICSALFGGGHGGIAAGVGNVNLALETKPTEPAVFSTCHCR
ncbi:hypothetical protein T03_13327 [Trichinella britovi]|uniref:Uncharacterized protein n=1 Tax=Trichinella britovi TaxID=45882 RepID=A0A0V1DBY9_TRIBR|nr:hypothetical protein T03_13327 [Trichinella britovi]